MPALQINQQIGTYRILRLLGEGGMGAVYEAEDLNLQRKVAVKVMLPDTALIPGARERFLREARAMAALHSDHIITIFQVGQDKGLAYFVMELLQGMPLDVYLSKNPRLDWRPTIRIGMEIAQGLADAHAVGLIHRDIKPGNIFLEAPRGRVKILDFGLARPQETATALTKSGAVVGTPHYMAPEQAAGKKIDGTADLFSLGVIFYEMTTGTRPFSGESIFEVLLQIGMHVAPPAISINPQVPPGLSQLIERLLEKNHEHRPQSAAEVAALLAAISNPGSASLEMPMPSSGRHQPIGPADTPPFSPVPNDATFLPLPESSSAPMSVAMPVTSPLPVSKPLPAYTRIQSSVDGLLVDTHTNQFQNTPGASYETIPEPRNWKKLIGILFLVLLLTGGAVYFLTQPKKEEIKTVENPKKLDPYPEEKNENGNPKIEVGKKEELKKKDELKKKEEPKKEVPKKEEPKKEEPKKEEPKKEEPKKEEPKKTSEITHDSIPKSPKIKDEVNTSLGMKFLWIPAGEFDMGSPETEGMENEHPQKKKKISKGFWMSAHEVTQKQWQTIMGENPSRIKGDDLPVENVSWEDCQKFIAKLKEKSKLNYALPTEAEWEYASRGGTSTKFNFGDEDAKFGEFAWFSKKSMKKPHPVGEKKANSWGLFDMHGNVWEWCQDWYDEKFYERSPDEDPLCLDGDRKDRVLRGGSFEDGPQGSRVALRAWASPSQPESFNGFRLIFRGESK